MAHKVTAQSPPRSVVPPHDLFVEWLQDQVEQSPDGEIRCDAAKTHAEIEAFLNTQTLWLRDVNAFVEKKEETSAEPAKKTPTQQSRRKRKSQPQYALAPCKKRSCCFQHYSEWTIMCVNHRSNKQPEHRCCFFPNPTPFNSIFHAPETRFKDIYLWSH